MADNKNRLESILSRFDADWTASDEARREAKNDLFFSRVSQWDDWLSQYTTLQYRGQFDVVRPVVRKLVLRCVRTLLMFCIVQRMEQVLTLLMC